MALILLIEDDSALRLNLQRILEHEGHEVHSAAGGSEGLRTWRTHGADLVLMDIHMPDMDGIEVLLQLRRLAPQLPVVTMSGGDYTGQLSALDDADLLGATARIPKPFSRQELVETIARALALGGAT